jgi:hypothetical protein
VTSNGSAGHPPPRVRPLLRQGRRSRAEQGRHHGVPQAPPDWSVGPGHRDRRGQRTELPALPARGETPARSGTRTTAAGPRRGQRPRRHGRDRGRRWPGGATSRRRRLVRRGRGLPGAVFGGRPGDGPGRDPPRAAAGRTAALLRARPGRLTRDAPRPTRRGCHLLAPAVRRLPHRPRHPGRHHCRRIHHHPDGEVPLPRDPLSLPGRHLPIRDPWTDIVLPLAALLPNASPRTSSAHCAAAGSDDARPDQRQDWRRWGTYYGQVGARTATGREMDDGLARRRA